MNFSVLPPEINSALMFAGAGPGPMLAAASAWTGLAGDLGSAAASFSAVTSQLATGSWQGPASAAMTGVAASYARWLTTAAAQAEQAAGQAQAAVSAFEAALAATVHPGAVSANRGRLRSLVVDWWGTPAIAEVEAVYEQVGRRCRRHRRLSRRGVGGRLVADAVHTVAERGSHARRCGDHRGVSVSRSGQRHHRWLQSGQRQSGPRQPGQLQPG
ncbi:PPE family protein [Mycobacterium tuberculosis EAI5/NITR206]|nr:PPE family protein [Mycobacterium tuberculosis EAI5/NITR206]